MNTSIAEKFLKSYASMYDKNVNLLAIHMFHDKVKPWLIKKEYTFQSGMGAWVVYSRTGKVLDHSEIPSPVLNVLEITIPLYDQELGTIMPCFPED